MTTFKRFLTLFLITTLTAFSVQVWGTEATLNSVSTKDVATTVGASVSLEFDGVTCTCTRHSTNQPGFYTSSGIVRYYSTDVMTLSVASGNTITQIDFVMTSGTVGTASPGTLTGNQWKGSAESVSFTGGGTVKISSITVTYSSGGGSTYTVTLDKNGNTSDITGCSGTYTLPTTGEHVANACEGWAWHCWANAAYSTGSPTSTAPSSTVITTMSSAGTAYAVYKHTETSGGSSTSTFVAASQGWGDSENADTKNIDNVTYSFAQNTGTNPPKYYNSGTSVRFYQNNSLTISSSSTITAIEFSYSQSEFVQASVSTGTVTDGNWSGSATSVTFTNKNSTQVRVSQIVVTMGGGSTTTYTSSPDCAECMNKVTLTKGTPEHGSFSLDKADGAHNNCAAGGLVVTISGITPADGYQFKEITQTGIASGVTINQTSKTVTYAKDVAGASTINVVFEAIPTYTVTLNKNGSTSDITGCTGTYTLPTTGEHIANACEGWAWHCWTDAAYSTGSPTSTAPSSTIITTMSSAGTAYAVYKHEEASGGSSTVSFAKADFSGDGTISASKSGVTVSCVGNIPSAGYVTFTEGNTLTISSSSGNITAIDFTCSGDDYTGNLTDVSGISTSSWSINVSNPGSKTTVRVSSIIVTIGGGSTTTYTSSPDCTPCDYKVTLTKGEESHGTFTLDKTNGVYNNCTSDFVVTVSGISPVSGYYCTGVTATGDHNEVTGPDGSGNYTVTYTKGNNITSEVTANFAPNPKYTVTWYMNGDETNQDSYEEGEDIVFPGSADGCDGKVFRGWSADPVAETNVEPSYVTSATMPAHDVTYYAVYAEAGSGTPSSVSYAFTDLSWNATGGNWTSGKNGAGYNNSGVQVTTGASGANATCPNSYSGITSIDVSYCTNGSSGAGSITMEVNGTSLTNTITKTGGTTARNTSFDFSSTTPTGSPRITVTCTTNSIYVCGVTIHYGGTTYSGYTTTCGAGISAQNIGWITTSAGQKVKRVISVSAKNFEDDVTLAATCANSHFALTLGATAVPAGAGGLTTTLTVEYTPTAPGKEENVEIVLTAGDKSRTITVNGRCVPDEFLLITKKLDKWYALPANMNSGSGEYDGVEVSPNDATTPTAVPVSPSTLIYNLASVASSRYAANGNLVRLVGNNNKCLWGNTATGATKVNIQNYAALAESNGVNYEWDMKTTDGVHYFVESPCNDEYAEGRRLAYGTKFGMYKEETVFFIVRAGCSSQPGEIVVSPRRVDATFSWVSNTTQMHIDLYTNSEMTEGHLSATASSSPYVFTGLAESTDYWYKLTPGDDTDCAVTGTFKTTGPIIDIVEWKEDSVVLFIDKGDINPLIVIDGQEEHGSITGGGGNATELFFSKYFEGSGDMKLVAIFNGTDHDIDLSDYKLYTKNCGTPANESALATSSFGGTTEYPISALGTIKAGHEIVFFTRPLTTGTQANLSACSVDYLNDMATHKDVTDNPRWIECNNSTKYGGSKFPLMQFNGNDAICLEKNDVLIDVIGATGDPGKVKNCANRLNDVGWSIRVKNMDYGKSVTDEAFDYLYEASTITPSNDDERKAILNGFGINIDDEYIDLTTARCILFRDKRVVSGDSAVTMNDGAQFVTCTSHIEGGKTYLPEWNGRVVCMDDAHQAAAGVDDDSKATCNSYKDLGAFNFTEYYIDWSTIDPGQTLDNFTSDPETKEYTIPIDDMRQYACLKLRFQLVHEGNVLTEASQQVPIVVVGNNVDTNDPLFSELVIDKVNPSDPSTWVPSYSHSKERCKDCDVVVLGAASLTKGSDSDAKDVPEVGNVKVYPGGKLIVPTGTTYTMKSLALRRQEDVVASADIQGTITFKAPSASPAPRREEGEAQHAKKAATGTKSTYFDLRIDPTNWHFISLPYDVNVSDIRFANPEETAIPVLGTDYLLQWYDGERRAATKNDDAWEPVAADATLKAGLGYIFALPGSGKVKREFRFPMDNEVITLESANKTASPVYGYGCDQPSLGSNHKGWNLVGAPYLTKYLSDLASPLRTGKLIEDHTSPEHNTPTWDGAWTDDGSPLRYIAIPINNGWDYYYQEEISGYELPPFTSYFVQIDGTDPTEAQVVGFNASRVIRSSIVRRDRSEYEEEEDTHPVWCAINLTNPQGETDKTTVLISNDFTDNYDMMNDMVKMRGSYYSYYTRPVLASRNNEGEMAFNALPDSSALAGIPLNFFAAGSGSYTISFNERYGREEVKAVMLLDKNNNQWYNLLDEPYSFTTNRVNDKNRFVLSVRVERKKPQTPTDIVNPSVMGDGSAPRKILINNRVYILRGGKIYDVTGKQLLNL